MPRMHYTARNLAGEVVEGRDRASDEEALRDRLSRRGLEVLKVREEAAAPGGKGGASMPPVFGRVSTRLLATVTGQLALMLQTGTSLVESLDALAEQVADERLSGTLRAVANEVRGGATLATALASHPRAFSTFYVSTVRAGEASGRLPGAFKRLETHMQKRIEVGTTVATAMIYPAVISVLAVVAVAVVVTFVVPKFMNVFASTGMALPLPTRMLISFSQFMSSYWYAVAGLVTSLAAGLAFFLRSTTGRLFTDRLVLRLPMVGPLVKTIHTSAMLRTLGTLMGAGVSLVDSLEIARDTAGNTLYRQLVDSVSAGVLRGEGLAGNFSRTGLLSPAVKQMVATGEQTGSLASVMNTVADHLDETSAKRLKALSAVFEPLIIVAMGGVIGFIAVAVLLPLFRLSSAASGGG